MMVAKKAAAKAAPKPADKPADEPQAKAKGPSPEEVVARTAATGL